MRACTVAASPTHPPDCSSTRPVRRARAAQGRLVGRLETRSRAVWRSDASQASAAQFCSYLYFSAASSAYFTTYNEQGRPGPLRLRTLRLYSVPSLVRIEIHTLLLFIFLSDPVPRGLPDVRGFTFWVVSGLRLTGASVLHVRSVLLQPPESKQAALRSRPVYLYKLVVGIQLYHMFSFTASCSRESAVIYFRVLYGRGSSL